MNKFAYIVFACAVVIAVTSGYFSVFGISSLFSGAFYAVLVMASVLEIGKIVAATFLKQYWNQLTRKMRWFMCSQVLILMVITSGGIFGFLSAAYQETSRGATEQEIEVQSLGQQRTLYESDITRDEQRMSSLVASREQLMSRTDSLYANNMTQAARRTEASVVRTDEQIDALTAKIQPTRDSVSNITRRILQTETGSSVSAEIGPLKYLAASLGTETDTVVKWFILLIIVVFDPLGIALFLAAITIRDVDKLETVVRAPEPDVEPPVEPIIAPRETDVVDDETTFPEPLDEDTDVSEEYDDVASERRERIEKLFNDYRNSGDTRERASLSKEIETQLNSSPDTVGIRTSPYGESTTTFTSNGGVRIER